MALIWLVNRKDWERNNHNDNDESRPSIEHGGPSVLKYIDVDMPTIGDEACVRLGGAIAVLGARITQDGFDLKMNTLSFIFGELNMVGVRGCGRRNQELCMRLLGEGKIKPVIGLRTKPISGSACIS